MTKIQKHEELCNLIHSTYVKKNHDYGDSFGKSCQKWGITAAMVRMEDKWNRLNNLITVKDAQVDESIEDTLLDLANYAIMTYLEIQGVKE